MLDPKKIELGSTIRRANVDYAHPFSGLFHMSDKSILKHWRNRFLNDPELRKDFEIVKIVPEPYTGPITKTRRIALWRVVDDDHLYVTVRSPEWAISDHEKKSSMYSKRTALGSALVTITEGVFE